ncbi:hypothetical protein V8G54_017966 [Vigna mungo]|uniref:Uncharacterized protein n=1 Tax=Vigna mungo TaxID=3915 RepID=A0AAQ3N742_VIGMU
MLLVVTIGSLHFRPHGGRQNVSVNILGTERTNLDDVAFPLSDCLSWILTARYVLASTPRGEVPVKALRRSMRNMDMVRSRRITRRLGTMKKYTKIAVLVFKLVFSAVFGNPITAIASLVEALVSD